MSDKADSSEQEATNLRYARGLLRKAAASGAAFVDVNADVLRYLVENRRTLDDKLRWAKNRAEAAECETIAHIANHWFTQGGEAQFGALGQPTNPDELVSTILERVRQGDRKALLDLLDLMDEWLGNSDGLMIEDVIGWRDRLAVTLGKGPRG